MIRVFVADDHAVVREGLERILERAHDMTFAGAAADVPAALAALADARAHVLVLDLSLPGGGIEALRLLRDARPELAVVVYSMYPEDQYGPRLLRAGASAYLSKGRPTATLLEAIRRAHVGRRYITEDVAERLLEAPNPPEPGHEALSDREVEVLQLLVEGSRPSEVALRLAISASTVSTHIRRIREKLGVQSVAEMIRYALRHRLIE